MALPQAPLTDDQVKMIIESPMPLSDSWAYRRFMETERWPHLVHYVGGKTIYCPPDHFCFKTPSGPSDCVWIVPGTL